MPGFEKMNKIVETKAAGNNNHGRKSKSNDLLKYTALNNRALAVY